MNHIYKVVWNSARQELQVASELSTSQSKSSKSATQPANGGLRLSTKLSLLSALIFGMCHASYADILLTEDQTISTEFTKPANGIWTANDGIKITITPSGKLIVPDTVFGGIHLKDNAELNNYGVLENNQTITGQEASKGVHYVNNHGELINNGTISNSYGLNGKTELYNAATGVITNTTTGFIEVSKLVNDGQIFNNATGYTKRISITSTLENNAGGTFTNNSVLWIAHNTGLINNKGTFINEVNGVVEANSSYAKIDNTGTIENKGKLIVYPLNNYGTFNNQQGGTTGDGALNLINNYGTTNNFGTIASRTFNGESGIFNNESGGQISSGYALVVGDSSVLNNKAGATIAPYSQDNYVAVAGNGTLNNQGDIILDTADVSKSRFNGDLTFYALQGSTTNNSGQVTLKGNEYEGISSLSTHNAELRVEGTFNNQSKGKLTLNEHANINIGRYNSKGDVNVNKDITSGAKLVNSGVITGASSGDYITKVNLWHDGVLEMTEGSTLSGAQLFIRDDIDSSAANATLKFTSGSSSFNPAEIHFKGFLSSNVLNIDVASNVTQAIASNILQDTSSAGIINKKGAGNLILNGQSTYTAGTTVEQGALYIGDASHNTASIKTGAEVKNGGTLGGNGTVNGNVTVADGGKLSAGTGLNSAGTLTVNGNLTLGAGSSIDYDLSDSANDSIKVTGALATNGASVNVNAIDNIASGLIREVLSYGSITDDSLKVGTTPDGTSATDYKITHVATDKKIYINALTGYAPDNMLKFWNPQGTGHTMGSGGDGTWSADGNTWANQSGNTLGKLDADTQYAIFGGKAGTVTVDGNVSAKGLQFLNNYTLNGDTITLDSGTAGQTLISTGASGASGNTVTINNVIAGSNGLNKVDGGTLILTGANTYTGGTTVSQGTLQGNTDSIKGNTAISDGASLVFNQQTDGAFSGAISGAGTLTKQGAGELTLSGANTYTGGSKVTAGTLAGNTSSLTGNVDISSGAALKFDQNSSGTYAGVVSGAGKLVKEGTDTLTLSGTNTYTGGTDVNNGTLQGDTNSLQGNVTLANNSTLAFNQQTDGTYSGSVSGTGNITKSGSAALTLNGQIASDVNTTAGKLTVGDSNTPAAKVTGNVNVAGGATLAGNGTVAGTVTMADGANFSASKDRTLTVDDLVLDGKNAIVLDDLGNIDVKTAVVDLIVANNGITGDFDTTTITNYNNETDYLYADVAKNDTGNKYVLEYGLSWYSDNADIAGGAFTVADSFTVNTELSDVTSPNSAWDGKTLTKAGAGKLILNGANTYTGDTNVQSGTLLVGGSADKSSAAIAGNVNVASGAKLGGHGNVLGDVTLSNGAILSPGSSIGTLTVNNITFNAGSIYEFEANPDGSADLVNATGSATINGGTVSVLASEGAWAANTQYTILKSAGTLAGDGFSDVTSNLAFLTPTLSSDTNNVYLDLTRNDTQFTDVAYTYNQKATAGALQSMSLSNPLVTDLTGMEETQARAAFDNLSGEIHASAKNAVLNNTRYMSNAINQHLIGNTGRVQEPGVELWFNTWWHGGHLKSNGNAAKLDNKGGGFLLGFDTYSTETAQLGLAAGYERTNTDVGSSRRSSADIDAFHLFSYGGTKLGGVDIRGQLGYSWLDFDTTRNVDLSSLRSRNKASYDGGLFNASLEASYSMALTKDIHLTPYANLSYSHLKTDGFRESGSVGALRGSSESDNQTTSTLGLRGDIKLNDAVGIYGDAGWQHNYGNRETKSRLRFDEGSSFSVKGVSLNQNAAVLNAGVSYQFSPDVSAKLGYNGTFGDKTRDNSANLNFEMRF